MMTGAMKLKKRGKKMMMKKSLPLCFLLSSAILVMTWLGEESKNEKGDVNNEQQGCCKNNGRVSCLRAGSGVACLTSVSSH